MPVPHEDRGVLLRIAVALGLVAFVACSSQPPAEFRVDRDQLPVCGVHTAQPVIGLSFDGGPGPYTEADLRLVRSVGARATFFVTAKHMADYPNGVPHELADGMDVENHTWSHPVMPLLSLRSQRAELSRTQAALVAAGVPTPTLWRPPYGAADHGTLETASTLGLRAIMWEHSIEIRVRYPNPDPRARAEELAGELAPGEILLAHDSIPLASTTQTLQFLLPMLKARGYRLVSIPELLAEGSPVLGYARWGTEIDGHPVMRGGCPPAWPAPSAS
jgi:peptidoglycan/xylan/chitin deacetylase (PgdA/CDA1 family)